MAASPERLPKIPRSANDDHDAAAVAARRSLLEEQLRRPLPHLAKGSVPYAEARGKIENQIGHAQVPLGIAGPMWVDTSDGIHDVYVPMATTEGAMVASYSRGMRVLNSGGPIRARMLSEGLTQNPIFVYASAQLATQAAQAIPALRADFDALVAATTAHGRLQSVRPEQIGRRLVVRFEFTTGDAIGINMAAKVTEGCCELIARNTAALHRFVHGQDVEKRANARALIEGRGRSVVAEAVVSREALLRGTRATPEQMVEALTSYRIGFAQLGTQNWLVQAANGLAAVFLATGQDLAYITECATGQLDFSLTSDGDLHASAHLPSLLVGTVGGGTHQGTAAECLEILGCLGNDRARRFAEFLAAMVLAGDLSLMAAFCSHEFVDAHERLGRNRPSKD